MKTFFMGAGLLAAINLCCYTKAALTAETQAKLLTCAPWKRMADDSLYIFKTDATFVAPHTGNAKWHISGDGNILTITEQQKMGGAEFPYQIVMLNTRVLKLTRVLGEHIFTETYSH